VAAPSGRTVYLAAGTYPYQSLSDLGSRSDYVTFEPSGYGGNSPAVVTIDGLSLSRMSYLSFQGLHFVGNDTSTEVPAVKIDQGSNIQLLDNDVTGQGNVDLYASNVQIQGNYIHNETGNCKLDLQEDEAGICLSGGDLTLPLINNIQIDRPFPRENGSYRQEFTRKNAICRLVCLRVVNFPGTCNSQPRGSLGLQYGGSVAHLHNPRRDTGGNGPRREVAGDDAASSHHTTGSNRNPGQDDHTRAQPDAGTDRYVLFDPRLAHHGNPGVVAVVGGGDVDLRPEQRVFADYDSALRVSGPQSAVLPDV